MKKFVLLFLFIGCVMSLHAQSVVTVTSPDGTSKIFSTIKEAIDGASDNDIVYLPAGSYSLADVPSIDKKLHIIGAGYNPTVRGAEGITSLRGSIYLLSGMSGGSVQGLSIEGSVFFGNSDNRSVEINNIVISRCSFNGLFLGYSWDGIGKSNNVLISECIVRTSMWGGRCSNVKVEKCIIVQQDIQSRLITYFDDAIFTNNILIPLDSYACNYVTNCIFQNNIITAGAFYYVNTFSGNKLFNNLYSHGELNTAGVTVSTGNVRMDLDKIFVNFDAKAPLSFENDYQLTKEAINAIKSTDGTQVGIYGTNAPFKKFGIPVNPFIKEAKVSTKTNAKGQLKVEFKVEAQSN